MIRLHHLLVISTVTVRFWRLVKSLIFPPKWNNSYLRVSEDRVRIYWRTEPVDYSVVSVSLPIFATVEIIFSNYLPWLMLLDALFTALTCTDFFHLILLSPIIVDNTALTLHYQSHADTWWWVRVMLVSIIVTWVLGDAYYPLDLHLPPWCLDFLNRKDSMGSLWFHIHLPWGGG